MFWRTTSFHTRNTQCLAKIVNTSAQRVTDRFFCSFTGSVNSVCRVWEMARWHRVSWTKKWELSRSIEEGARDTKGNATLSRCRIATRLEKSRLFCLFLRHSAFMSPSHRSEYLALTTQMPIADVVIMKWIRALLKLLPNLINNSD